MAKLDLNDSGTAQTGKISAKAMIVDILTTNDDKNGVSFQKIKKLIVEKYHVDMDHYIQYVKKALVKGVNDELFKNTSKAAGASGKCKKFAKKHATEK